MAERWKKVTVVGCGLIGASFALAMRQSRICDEVAGWDLDQAVRERALELGVIDSVDASFANNGSSDAELVYLAMPVSEIAEFLRLRGNQLKPDTIVTDAGSTKLELCRIARESVSSDCVFVGGHPVAGSHLSGLENASAELFSGAPYILTPGDEPRETAASRRLSATLELFGARVYVMTASEHDRAMALVSHLPQLVSSALAATVNSQPDAAALVDVSGTGFRDTTRLASSSWSMWRDILATNPSQIAASLDTLLETLARVRDELRDHAIEPGDELSVARNLFDSVNTNGNHQARKYDDPDTNA